MPDSRLPAGWPASVAPPGTEDFAASAIAWLLDAVPDLRLHAARSHPVILAAIAGHILNGAAAGARQGYRTVRTDLGDAVPPHVVDVALSAYQQEGRRLADAAAGAGLVERALRGEPLWSLNRRPAAPR